MIMSNSDYVEKIKEIWERHKESIPKHNGIVLSPKFEYKIDYYPDGVLKKFHINFVGLNPSFNVESIQRELCNKNYNLSVLDVFNLEKLDCEITSGNQKMRYIDIINELDTYSVIKYRYFRYIREYAKKYNFSFSYSDLFLFRCSSQKELAENYEDEKESGKGGFFKDQIDFFFDKVLPELKGKKIVVLNKYSYKIIEENLRSRCNVNNIELIDGHMLVYRYAKKEKKEECMRNILK